MWKSLISNFYKKLFNKFNESKYQEHVTNYMYEHLIVGNFIILSITHYRKLPASQLAIDTESDFMLANQILNSFKADHTKYDFEDVFKRMIEIQRLH